MNISPRTAQSQHAPDHAVLIDHVAAPLDNAAAFIAPPEAGYDEFQSALREATIARGILKTYGNLGYPPAIEAAATAVSELIMLTHAAISGPHEGAPTLRRPDPGRISTVVDDARAAAEMLRASSAGWAGADAAGRAIAEGERR